MYEFRGEFSLINHKSIQKIPAQEHCCIFTDMQVFSENLEREREREKKLLLLLVTFPVHAHGIDLIIFASAKEKC